jgi:pimeloyl-ACP methyl ester carboxylesterase
VARPLSVQLALEDRGEGAPIVLLHGLTATRRYVVMGSRALERAGLRVIAYDARGHGASAPAPDGSYRYEDLVADLEGVFEQCGLERAVLAGSSMGAHTAVRFALAHPGRVAGLGLITPAYDPEQPHMLEGWDRLAEGLRRGGVEGFIAAYDFGRLPERWRETVETGIRQRMVLHEHPEAVADALQGIPRSPPLQTLDVLESIEVPCVVVGDRDDADPGHPLEVAEKWAQRLPRARLVVEEEGRSPIAWQGGQISRVLRDLVAESV